MNEPSCAASTPEVPARRNWASVTDLPLAALAVATIPLLVVEATSTGTVAAAAVWANWTIWACFAVDLVVRTSSARGSRWRYLVRHWYDVVIVAVTVVPYLMPVRALRSVRVLRLLRASRVATYGLRIWHTAADIWTGLVARWLLVAMPAVVAAGATGVWIAESGTNSTLASYGDALWWAIVTVTTVGYGDISPITAWGRIVATALMIIGIGLFGVVTANIAAYVNRQRDT